ncbi:MAG: MAPEG family protein [Nodosilinea sp.]
MKFPIPMPGFLLVSIFLGTILIYLPYGVVAYGRFRVGYNLSTPRAMFPSLPGYAQRATWAHENAFESMIVYSPAALMAYLTQQQSEVAMGAVGLYLVGRSLYPLFYILDIPLLRSLMFAVANLGTLTLYLLSCRSVL